MLRMTWYQLLANKFNWFLIIVTGIQGSVPYKSIGRISESKGLSFRFKDKLVDLQMVCSFQKLLKAIPFCWWKSDRNEAIWVLQYWKFTILSPSRAFGVAPSLWQFMCMIFVLYLLILNPTWDALFCGLP